MLYTSIRLFIAVAIIITFQQAFAHPECKSLSQERQHGTVVTVSDGDTAIVKLNTTGRRTGVRFLRD